MSISHDPHMGDRRAHPVQVDRDFVGDILGEDKPHHAGTPEQHRSFGQKVVGRVLEHKLATGLTIAATAGGVLAVPSIIESAENSKSFDGNRYATTIKPAERTAALKGADHLVPKTFILKAGSNLRLTPELIDDAVDGPNNFAGTVPKGEEIQVDNPLTDVSRHPGWIAFSMPSKQIGEVSQREFDSIKNRAGHTVWANVSKLEAEGYAEEYSNTAISSDNSVIDVKLGDQGQIMVESPFTNSGVDETGKMQVTHNYSTVSTDAAISIHQKAGDYESNIK